MPPLRLYVTFTDGDTPSENGEAFDITPGGTCFIVRAAAFPGAVPAENQEQAPNSSEWRIVKVSVQE